MICRKTLNQYGFTLIEIIVTVVIVAILGAMILTFLSKSLVGSTDPVKSVQRTSDINKVMANIIADYNQFPKWQSLTNYVVGNKVLPVSMNGRYYTCISAGKSGVSEPNWSDVGNVIDGFVKWDVKPWMWISTSAGMWKSATNYSIGDIVIPTNPNGHFYRCKTAGTSGATEPIWPKIGGSTISDGGVVWTRLIQYLKEAVGTPDSNLKSNSYGQCPGSNCISYYVTANKFIKFVSNAEMDISSGNPENILKMTLKNDEGGNLTVLFMVKEY